MHGLCGGVRFCSSVHLQMRRGQLNTTKGSSRGSGGLRGQTILPTR